jgi:hypothetical protein
MAKPAGRITRGTTGFNRLRRVDRWIAVQPVLRRTDDPLIVDLGYGASATTTLELRDRLARVRHDVQVIGIEIDPQRVRDAAAATRDGVTFRLGGFEVPTERPPAIIRALNVLRQYDESEVAGAWSTMRSRLQPGGLLVEGTCSELGRVASWVSLDASGPRTFTISLRLAELEQPSVVAERLPKVLIHRNVPGERVHELLAELDRQWAVAAPLAVYGPSQRWIAAVEALRTTGWPVRDGRTRWRLGELTLDWESVAP